MSSLTAGSVNLSQILIKLPFYDPTAAKDAFVFGYVAVVVSTSAVMTAWWFNCV